MRDSKFLHDLNLKYTFGYLMSHPRVLLDALPPFYESPTPDLEQILASKTQQHFWVRDYAEQDYNAVKEALLKKFDAYRLAWQSGAYPVDDRIAWGINLDEWYKKYLTPKADGTLLPGFVPYAVNAGQIAPCHYRQVKPILNFGYLFLGDISQYDIRVLEHIELSLRYFAQSSAPWGGVKVFGYFSQNISVPLFTCKAFYEKSTKVYFRPIDERGYYLNTGEVERFILGFSEEERWKELDLFSNAWLYPKAGGSLKTVTFDKVPRLARVFSDILNKYNSGTIDPRVSINTPSFRSYIDHRSYYTATDWLHKKPFKTVTDKKTGKTKPIFMNDPRGEFYTSAFDQKAKVNWRDSNSRYEFINNYQFAFQALKNNELRSMGWSQATLKRFREPESRFKSTQSPSILTRNPKDSNNEKNVIFTGVIDLDLDDVLNYYSVSQVEAVFERLMTEAPYLCPQFWTCSGNGIHAQFVPESPFVGRIPEVRALGKKLKDLLMSYFDANGEFSLTRKEQKGLAFNQAFPIVGSLTKTSLLERTFRSLTREKYDKLDTRNLERVPTYPMRLRRFNGTDLEALYEHSDIDRQDAQEDWELLTSWARQLSTFGYEALGTAPTNFPDVDWGSLLQRITGICKHTPKLTYPKFRAIYSHLRAAAASVLAACPQDDAKLYNTLKRTLQENLELFVDNSGLKEVAYFNVNLILPDAPKSISPINPDDYIPGAFTPEVIEQQHAEAEHKIEVYAVSKEMANATYYAARASFSPRKFPWKLAVAEYVKIQKEKAKKALDNPASSLSDNYKISAALHSFIVSNHLPVITGNELKANGIKTTKQEVFNALFHQVVDINHGTEQQFIQEYLKMASLNPDVNIWYITDFKKYSLEKRLLPLELRELCYLRYCATRGTTLNDNIQYTTRRAKRAYKKEAGKLVDLFKFNQIFQADDEELEKYHDLTEKGDVKKDLDKYLDLELIKSFTPTELNKILLVYRADRTYQLIVQSAHQERQEINPKFKPLIFKLCQRLGVLLRSRAGEICTKKRCTQKSSFLPAQRAKVRQQFLKSVKSYEQYHLIRTLMMGRDSFTSPLVNRSKHLIGKPITPDGLKRFERATTILIEQYGWTKRQLRDKGRYWKPTDRPYSRGSFYGKLYAKKKKRGRKKRKKA